MTGPVKRILAGASEADIAKAFLTSGEYQAKHRSDVEYLTGLYTDLFFRPPDPSGLTHWQGELRRGVSRATAARAFLTSKEKYKVILSRYYTDYLHRAIDPSGLASWTKLLESGSASLSSVGAAIMASDEYFRQV